MQTINSKITDNFTGGRRNRAPLARRIANACAVKILQQDLSKTNGATAETLTNDLCYVNPMYDSFDELQMFVESVAHNIQEFTAYQYFFKNKDNGEYHLCVEGGINYEELVNIYASNMPDGTKDEYFFQFLQEALTLGDEVYRSSFKIYFMPSTGNPTMLLVMVISSWAMTMNVLPHSLNSISISISHPSLTQRESISVTEPMKCIS